MSYSVKKSKTINAKFKSLAVDDLNNFIDLETGEIINIAKVISQTVGEGQPVDVVVSNKDDEDITPEE